LSYIRDFSTNTDLQRPQHPEILWYPAATY
jgi:hypothetical protein